MSNNVLHWNFTSLCSMKSSKLYPYTDSAFFLLLQVLCNKYWEN